MYKYNKAVVVQLYVKLVFIMLHLLKKIWGGFNTNPPSPFSGLYYNMFTNSRLGLGCVGYRLDINGYSRVFKNCRFLELKP